MQAIVCHEYGELNKLSLEETPEPVATDSQLLLKVLAAGVNFPDGLLIQGLYQAKPDTPFVPGMECCGEVLSVGRACGDFKPGDRVIH